MICILSKLIAFFSLRKQPTFHDIITGFTAKWRLRNKRRNSILMTRKRGEKTRVVSPWLFSSSTFRPRSTIWTLGTGLSGAWRNSASEAIRAGSPIPRRLVVTAKKKFSLPWAQRLPRPHLSVFNEYDSQPFSPCLLPQFPSDSPFKRI